ncbi:CobD/CbiB family protein [Nitrosovibrio sp. Nv4]|uniref:CobD/CbiB family protein n=1 Tax=Nitrosovibrio sp. Nv4 TaxID=1945880 RepID=UPI000BC9B1C6|nr:CobD/CbiB family protein [Nitrosovibrio sp. Nv4]SOD42279.1 adenosylcobinamide-phosphate synthase [Nitrosovibrio sp. Nv4]
MTFFSLIFVLLLERWRPGSDRNRIVSLFLSYADSLEGYFNTGLRRHIIAAWVVAVIPVLLLSGWIYYLLYSLSPLLAWAWNVITLYLTMCFRQFSYSSNEISDALQNKDLFLARKLLWKLHGVEADDLSSQEIARITIEMGLIYSHRYVFGVIICFALLPGPLGAVLYRLAELLDERWGARPDAFGDFAVKAFRIIDWLPARATAMSFAIAGNFEDAIYCWRAQAASWMDRNQGIILASGAGALGVCLGDPLREAGSRHYRPELGVGEEADADFLQSTVGLVWRTLILWLALLLLLEIATWAG